MQRAALVEAGTPDGREPKRQRLLPGSADEPLLERIAARPSRWLPVAAALLQRRGHDLAPRFVLALLSKLAPLLQVRCSLHLVCSRCRCCTLQPTTQQLEIYLTHTGLQYS